MSKLSLSIRNLALLATLAMVTTGCGKDAALPWHYWLAPVLALSALGIVLVAMPNAYFRKVWRLKNRGR